MNNSNSVSTPLPGKDSQRSGYGSTSSTAPLVPPEFEGRTPVSENDFWNKYEVKYYDSSISEQLWDNVKGCRPFPSSKEGWKRWGRKRFPLVTWLPSYDKQSLLSDIIASITIAVLNIPQGISYALLAGVPPQHGLYTSIFPAFAYALFGTSRQISVGTFALVALMTSQAVTGIVGEGSIDGSATNIRPEYIDATISVCFTVGILEIIMGLLNLSVVTLFLSDALLSGFTCGTAFHIATSQLKQLSGLTSPSYNNPGGIFQKWVWYLKEIPNWNPADAVCGFISIAILLIIRQINIRYKKKFFMPIPGELIVTALGILIAYLGDLGNTVGLTLLGEVPAGLPIPTVPSFTGGFGLLFVASIPIAVVAFVISISIVKTFAKKHGYHTSATQELYALGIASMFGSFFLCFPPSGSLSRSAVGNEAGQKTQIAALLQGGILIIVLLFLTPLFEYLPNSVLGAIILVALRGLLMQVFDAKEYAKIKAADFYVWLISFTATLIFNVTIGIIISLAANLSVIIIRTSRPSIQLLGWVPRTEIYRDKDRVQSAVDIEGIVILRFNASLYFSNARFLQDCAVKAIQNSDQDSINSFILDCNPINDIDTAGVKMLLELRKTLKKQNITLYLAMCKAAVRDVLKKGGFYDDEGSKYLFVSLHDAVVFAVHCRLPQELPSDQQVGFDPEDHAENTTAGDNDATGDDERLAFSMTDADVAISMMNANLDNDDDDEGLFTSSLRRRHQVSGELLQNTNTNPESNDGGLAYVSRLQEGSQLELPVYDRSSVPNDDDNGTV